MKIYVLRLMPGSDLRLKIAEFAKKKHIKAGAVITCVGSLTQATLRLAKDLQVKTYKDTFEIVSLVGTFEEDDMHLHMSICDKNGNTIGGHVRPGCIVHVTAELVLGELENYVFDRQFDKNTGYEELEITQIKT